RGLPERIQQSDEEESLVGECGINTSNQLTCSLQFNHYSYSIQILNLGKYLLLTASGRCYTYSREIGDGVC
ncbi:MAG: hypothetical protein MJZ83_11515, partial [Bacteroidaceae bacterium]|nr:hypothetical protein [Bacteroidaceae bacterium]